MKTLTVPLSEEVYERAERRAADRGVSLPGEVAELVKRYSEGDQPGDGKGAARPEAQPPDGNAANLLQELARVADECASADWDGAGAAPVNPETLRHAQRFVNALPASCPLPSVGVEPDGHLTLEWYRNPRQTLSISVSPEADLYYAALFATNDVRGREAFNGTVPEIILSLIGRAVAA